MSGFRTIRVRIYEGDTDRLLRRGVVLQPTGYSHPGGSEHHILTYPPVNSATNTPTSEELTRAFVAIWKYTSSEPEYLKANAVLQQWEKANLENQILLGGSKP